MEASAHPRGAQQPLFTLRGISKRFPLVLANDAIDLDIYAGEIHALLGENGAGKSTLMKILYGFYRPDAGRMTLDGREAQVHSPADARRLGIGMIFQDFSLIPALSVAENIALFLQDVKAVVNLGQVERRIQEIATRYGLLVRADVKVAELALGELQKVEILKLLLSGARILILDEPTRVLAPHEVAALLRVLEGLRADGYAIILITHKIKEVLACADRITVLRGGRVAGTLLRAEASEGKLIERMFGKELSELTKDKGRTTKDERRTTDAPEIMLCDAGIEALADQMDDGKNRLEPHILADDVTATLATGAAQAPVLELRDVATRGEGAATSLHDVTLAIYPGEIVGVAGISGNGQRELGDLALGLIPCAKGEKLLFGQPATRLSIRQARRHGVAFIPENPLAMASIPFMTVLENLALTRPWRYARRGGLALNWAAVKDDALAGLQKLAFNLPLYALARALSGGNLQRMVIVRELGLGPRLIVASYVTRGLDVQSAVAARQALLDARNAGAGVLLISEDLDELFALSDRLIVLYEGRIVGRFRPDETDAYRVGYLMTGAAPAQPTADR